MLHYFYLVISSFFDIYWSVYHTNSNQQPWGYVSFCSVNVIIIIIIIIIFIIIYLFLFFIAPM